MLNNEIDIGSRFKELRLDLRLNQKQLADHLCVKQSKISKIENNNVKFDIIYIVHDLCKLAGITIEQFLGTEKPEPLYLNDKMKEFIKKAQYIDEELLNKLIDLLKEIDKEKT